MKRHGRCVSTANPQEAARMPQRRDARIKVRQEAARLFCAGLLFLVLLSGCACKPEIVWKTEYRDVYVPVKCDVSMPDRPEINEDAVIMVLDLVGYAAELEALLEVCR